MRSFSLITRAILCGMVCFACSYEELRAQYFGQNKMGYRTLEFATIASPHLQLYYYCSDSSAIHFIQEAERWYGSHQLILGDTIKGLNPLILYNHHADFQQTTLFNQNISPGTGGVTEGARKRVVMPYTHIQRETNHVLGHELVHAFQYDLVIDNDTLSLQSLQNVPLWIIEGLAEFLSIGRVDSHTAMWLRDAVVEDYFPSLSDLNTPRYFPYRYGHAFWAFVAGLWGDEIIKPLYMNINIYGLERGLLLTLGYEMKALSEMWKNHTKKHYQYYLQNKDRIVGEIAYQDGDLPVISPAVSPDGRYLAFYTQPDPISGITLTLADATNQKIIRQVNSIRRTSHIDFLSAYESAPTWSPDSKQLAVVLFSKGKNVISILEAKSGKIIDHISVEGVYSLMYPSWSPDGEHIAVSGMRDGKSDIYLVNLNTRLTRQLTDDRYSDIQPSWSEDGRTIVFSTDRYSYMQQKHQGFLNIALINVESKVIRNLPLFPGADNLGPQFTPDGGIIFLSDRDGFRNLYKHDLRISKTYVITNLATGISGITRYAQAVSFSPARSMVYYGLYQKGSYKLARAALKDFEYILVNDTTVDKSAGYLPPREPVKPESVTSNIKDFASLRSISPDSIKNMAYRPHFKLENVGSGGIGIGSSTGFGTMIGGGIFMKFSDVLGNNDLYAQVSVNGEIYDIGAGLLYLYKKHRIDWGVTISHIPRLNVFQSGVDEIVDVNGNPTLIRRIHTDILRTFIEYLSFLGQLPFSSHQRVEGDVGVAYQSFRIDRNTDSYLNNGTYLDFLQRDRSRREAPASIFQYFASAAWVGDNVQMGLVGPRDGYRYRVESKQLAGEFAYHAITVDGRWYRVLLKPLGVAFRIYHSGRYGKGGEDSRVLPLNVALPNFVRGYNFFEAYRNVSNIISTNNTEGQFVVNDYVGSKVLVGNAEIRIPFTGPKRVGLIKSDFFFSELALFADWGLAFSSTSYTQRLFNIDTHYTQQPIYSAGVSLRVNFFNIFVIEPFYAIPFKRVYSDGTKGRASFGLNFFPAW